MKIKGLNDNQMTVQTGISNGLIGKGRKRGSLSQENISKILYSFPELNANWWFRGEGNMLLSDSETNNVFEKYEQIMFSQSDSIKVKEEEIKKLKSVIQGMTSKR